jgi:large subunit ribosomal protein L9
MEVILLERVAKLGNIGDVVNVKDGYARNFLIPHNRALRANDANKAVFEAKKAELEAQNKERKKAAEKAAKKVEGLNVILIRQASEDGRLFGSVSARDISKEIQATEETVSHQQVQMNAAIKTIGIYPTKVMLHPEVICTVKVNIARSVNEANEALKAGIVGGVKAKSAIEELDAAEAPAEATAEVAAVYSAAA